MTQPKNNLQQTAMLYGTYLGLFWIIKFAFLPLGLIEPLLELVFLVLTFLGPLWVIWITRRFRDTQCDGELSYFSALIFSFQVYLFASILVAIGHYTYFEFIDKGFIYARITALFDEQEQLVPEMKEMFADYRHAMDVVHKLTPIQLTMQLISQNIFYAIILSLPTALICMKRKKF